MTFRKKSAGGAKQLCFAPPPAVFGFDCEDSVRCLFSARFVKKSQFQVIELPVGKGDEGSAERRCPLKNFNKK